MSAVIYNSRLAYNFRTLPWHQIGTPIQDNADVLETMKQLKLDYFVGLAKSASYQWLDGNPVEGLNEASIGNNLSVVRYDQYTGEAYVLGSASERFEIIQNAELAEIAAPLQNYGRLETMGALEDGERFFISFIGDAWSFLNKATGKQEEQQMYFIVKNTHLPGSSLQIQLTNVRLVCKNTWMAGDNSNILNIPLTHQGDAKMLAQLVINAMSKLPEHKEKIIRAAEYLSAKQVDEQWVKDGIDAAFPMPKKGRVQEALQNGTLIVPKELEMVGIEVDEIVARKDATHGTQRLRIEQLRNAALKTYRESNTVNRGTAWGYYNAVTETVDYLTRSEGATRQTDKAAQANFWGERAGFKAAAWDYAAGNN